MRKTITKEFRSIQPATYTTRHQQLAEEECLKEALAQFLDREPTLSDFIVTNVAFADGNQDEFKMYYGHILVGTVKRIYDGNLFVVQFTPAPEDDNKERKYDLDIEYNPKAAEMKQKVKKHIISHSTINDNA